MIQVLKITANKKHFLSLLLLGDVQTDALDSYLEQGEMFALYDGGLRTVAVVTKEPKRVFALRSVVTDPAFRRQGYGRRLLEYLGAYYHGRGRLLQAEAIAGSDGAGFCEKCGFTVYRTLAGADAGRHDDAELLILQKEL